MERKTPYDSAHRACLFMALALYLGINTWGAISWSADCTVLSALQYENYNRQTADNSKHKSCWDQEKWWEAKFFTDIKITDVLLAIFTGLLVVVGGWQGWQLKRTVDAMKIIDEGQSANVQRSIRQSVRAADAMERAATAMDESAWYTRAIASGTGRTARAVENTAERQLRAYISATVLGAPDIERNDLMTIAVMIKNHGQTPARDVITLGCMGFHQIGRGEDVFAEGMEIAKLNNPEPSKIVLHPQAERTLTYECPALTDAQRLIVLDGSLQRIFVWGEINYKDAFENRESLGTGWGMAETT